jgi:hypothetical protein
MSAHAPTREFYALVSPAIGTPIISKPLQSFDELRVFIFETLGSINTRTADDIANALWRRGWFNFRIENLDYSIRLLEYPQ